MTWPNLSAQAGEGRQSEAAAASENSALVRLESGPGRACSQAADSLSLWSQDHTGRLVRSCLGCISNPFLTNFAKVTSRQLINLPFEMKCIPAKEVTLWKIGEIEYKQICLAIHCTVCVLHTVKVNNPK